MQTILVSVLAATSNQTTLCLPFFLCLEGYFEGRISSVGSNQHFPQGWGEWKVNGGVKLA